MDFGWLWCVDVGSSVLTNVPLVGDIDNEGSCVCVRAGVYGKALYLPLNCSVNLKLLLKNSLNVKQTNTQTLIGDLR